MAHNLTPDLKKERNYHIHLSCYSIMADNFLSKYWSLCFLHYLDIFYLKKQKQIPDSGKINFPISQLFAIICLGLFFCITNLSTNH